MNLSAVIISKNEENNILKCIKSVAFCDEIILIDDDSVDNTVNIARDHGVKVFKRNLNANFAEQKNYGLGKAKGNWVLFLDADEYIDERLKDEIRREINKKNQVYSGFYIKRKDYLWGKEIKYGETGKAKLLRLAKRKSCSWNRSVHEVLCVDGSTKLLKNSIYHNAHPRLYDFLENVNFFSTIHAKANYVEDKKSNILKIVFWPLGKLINNLIFKLGFLDGGRGLIIAFMMSFHSYLAWTKLWLHQKER